MHSSIVVTKPAPDKALVTLYEAKLALNISTSSATNDEMLKMLILNASDEVGVLCSRVFPKETVIETFREVDNPITRLYLSRYPVKIDDILTVSADTEVVGFDVDSESGKLTLADGTIWSASVEVEYSGGYKIPQEVPPSLKQACLVLMRETYYSTIRGDSSIRAIAHKESRITYFDPNQAARGSGGGATAGSPAQRAAQALLQRYTRLVA